MAAVMQYNYAQDELDILAKKKFNVLTRSVIYLAEGILGFEFVDPDCANLEPFTAGSHIDIYLPNGAIRQYSLCNDPREIHRYVVAVLREPAGRGGSVLMHEQIRPGTILKISRPRNHFALTETASRYVLLAGGIGVTPMMAMVAELRHRGQPFHLYYCTRTLQRTAFLSEINELIEQGLATLVHDNGDPANGLDLASVLKSYKSGDQLYYCGPGGFLDAVEKSAAHWPAEARHCERFSGPVVDPGAKAADEEAAEDFDIKIDSTGEVLHVGTEQSIVDVLRANGIEVDTSCTEGYCGTCMTRYVGGAPAHHDTVLDDEDHKEYVMICCARAKPQAGCLVLDL